jgi:hypothetical protein
MDILETLGFNEKKIPSGYHHGIPKEIVRAADAEIRRKALIPVKEVKKQDELIKEMDEKTNEMNEKTLAYHNLLIKPIPEPAPVPTSSYYPSSKEYLDFHNDFTFYNTPLNFSIKDDILTVTNSTPNGKPLTIGMYSVISILSDKFDVNVMENMIDLKKGYKTLPNFDKLDKQIKQKSWDIQCMFTDLYQYSVPRVLGECKFYHELMALPLYHRIHFLEFERSLVSQKVANGIIEGLKERDAQLEQIRKDYLTKYENEKTLHRTEFDKFNRETLRFKIILEQLKARNDNLSQKLESVTTENSGYYDKVQDAERKAEKAEMTLTDLKIKLTNTEKKLAIYEDAQWEKDITSTDNKPVFYNKVSGQIVLCPGDLKEYTLTKIDNGNFVYTKDNKEFLIPDSLNIQYKDLMKPKANASVIDADKSTKKDENTLTQRQQKILNVILESEEPVSVFEISKITGIASNHINEEKKILLKKGLIIEDFYPEDNINKYYPS